MNDTAYYAVQGWYGTGTGWEDLTACENAEHAAQELATYNLNEPVPHRIVLYVPWRKRPIRLPVRYGGTGTGTTASGECVTPGCSKPARFIAVIEGNVFGTSAKRRCAECCDSID